MYKLARAPVSWGYSILPELLGVLYKFGRKSIGTPWPYTLNATNNIVFCMLYHFKFRWCLHYCLRVKDLQKIIIYFSLLSKSNITLWTTCSSYVNSLHTLYVICYDIFLVKMIVYLLCTFMANLCMRTFNFFSVQLMKTKLLRYI